MRDFYERVRRQPPGDSGADAAGGAGDDGGALIGAHVSSFMAVKRGKGR